MTADPGLPARSRHLVHVFPGFAVGGSQARFGELAAAHGARYRHTVIALDGRLDMKARLPDGVAIETMVPEFGKASGLRTLINCRQVLSALSPDLLVTYNWGAMDWCLANRLGPIAPHIHIEDGFGPDEAARQLQRRIWTRRLVLSGKGTRVIVPSRQLERIAAAIWRLPAKSIHYVPNGIDCRRFASAAMTREAATAITIGTVATLRAEKNLARLIAAFALAASENEPGALRLVIVGDGPERERLEAAAQASGYEERILFTGATETPEIELAKFDIFALTSDTEQMPLSVLEAMAARLPVVAFAVGDLMDMVAPENRPFVSAPLGSDKEFHTHLTALIRSAELRLRLGAANQVVAERHFDLALMAERYAALFG